MENICETQQSVLTEYNKVKKLLHTSQGSRERRIDENGVKTKKLWLKQDSKDLFAKKQSFQGLDLKKPRD